MLGALANFALYQGMMSSRPVRRSGYFDLKSINLGRPKHLANLENNLAGIDGRS